MPSITESGIVYLLTCLITGKQYVGQTWHFSRRMRDYRNGKVENQRALYNAIVKYGWDNFAVAVIASGIQTQDALDTTESAFIALLNTKAPHGYNLKGGGKGGGKHHAETKAKLSVLATGKKMPPRSAEHRAKLSEANRGQKRSPETCAKIGAKSRGRKWSPESRANLSASRRGEKNHMFGKKHSTESKAKMSKSTSASQLGKKRGPYNKRKNANQTSLLI